MNYKLLISIYSFTLLGSLPGYSDSPAAPAVTQPMIAQNLPSALYKIGVSPEDVGTLGITKTPPDTLLKAFRLYAQNSNDRRYASLSLPERDALVFFAFKLNSKGNLTDSSLADLMTAEKMRTGMPKAHIKELNDLVETIRANPNYELTYPDVTLVDLIAPFVNTDPYAFTDVLGTLVGPILQAKTENIGITPATETTLINAAKTVTGLTQEQLDNLQTIGDSYEESGQFQTSNQNVDDINQVMEVSYYPDGANLLLPFLGAGTLVALSNVGYAYPYAFREDNVYNYNREVVRNPTVERYNRAGIAPRYNNNWADNRARADARANPAVRDDAARAGAVRRGR